MVTRGAWILGGLGLAVAALLMLWMGRTLDVKAPVRIQRVVPSAPTVVPTTSPEEAAAREEASMRALVTRRASTLSARAAAQVYTSDEAGRASCTFTGATPVHRDGSEAWWDVAFSCVDPGVPGALPNLTSVPVRLHRAENGWVLDE
jgi:hypothetical protein